MMRKKYDVFRYFQNGRKGGKNMSDTLSAYSTHQLGWCEGVTRF